MAVNSAGSNTSDVVGYKHFKVNGLTNTLTPSPTTQTVKDHIPSSSASLPTLTVRVGRIGDTTDVTVILVNQYRWSVGGAVHTRTGTVQVVWSLPLQER